MDASVRKNTILQSLKAGVLSLVFSCIGVLLLALIAKLCNIGDNVLPIINQVLKVIAVTIGMIISLKRREVFIESNHRSGVILGVIVCSFSLLWEVNSTFGRLHWIWDWRL